MVPASQSTPTHTRAAASLDTPGSFVMSRTKTQMAHAVCPAASTANVESQDWGSHTASVTVDTQERPVRKVRVT